MPGLRENRLDGELGPPLPEMVFDRNSVFVHHPATGFTLAFLAVEALRQCFSAGEEAVQVLAASSALLYAAVLVQNTSQTLLLAVVAPHGYVRLFMS